MCYKDHVRAEYCVWNKIKFRFHIRNSGEVIDYDIFLRSKGQKNPFIHSSGKVLSTDVLLGQRYDPITVIKSNLVHNWTFNEMMYLLKFTSIKPKVVSKTLKEQTQREWGSKIKKERTKNRNLLDSIWIKLMWNPPQIAEIYNFQPISTYRNRSFCRIYIDRSILYFFSYLMMQIIRYI